MGKRKKSPASSLEDAAIILLTTDLSSLNEILLGPLRSKLRIFENQRQPSELVTPVNRRASPQRENPATPPSIEPKLPSGSLGKFLFRLLLSVSKIRSFFSAGKDNVIAQVFEQSDARIEVLRQFSHFEELKFSDKFRRLLADRNLALSHQRYHGGEATIADFAATLKLQRREDKNLAIDGIYRGRMWRKVEEDVGESGISAVLCCEHTLFKKNVPTSEMKEFARFLREPTFEPILQLAKDVSSLLEGSQRDFDAAMRGECPS